MTVSLGARGGEAVLEIADTGIGIPADEQDRLFERFYRASTARERSIEGTGLGLVIARAIAEAHGGRIGFESKEGAGTTFRVGPAAPRIGKCAWQDSNLRPCAPEAHALSPELQARRGLVYRRWIST